MLNGVFATGERIAGGPAAAWWGERLWLAYTDDTRRLRVRAVDVLGDPVTSTAVTLPHPVPDEPCLSSWAGRLWVAFTDDAGDAWLAASSDGTTFGSPRPLPLPSEHRVFAMAGTGSRLCLGWIEAAGGRVHVMTTTNGTAFTDEALAVDAVPALALVHDAEQDRLAMAWMDRAAGSGSLRVGLLDSDDLASGVDPQVAMAEPQLLAGLSLTVAGEHGGRRFLLSSYRFGPTGTGGPGATAVVEGRTVSADLVRIGGAEAFERAPTTSAPALASGGRRAWAAWRRGPDDVLVVAPHDLTYGLPAELEAKLGQDCQPDECPPDPRILCAATDVPVWVDVPAHVANAKRGDLVLTPADGAGLIAQLLSNVEPVQHYDHMGIMVADRFLIRHTTMAHERLTKTKELYTGTILDEPAPTDGMRPDLLKYGWPGTITQSVGDAFIWGFNTPVAEPLTYPYTTRNPNWDYYALHPTVVPPPRAPDIGTPARVQFDERRAFFHPELPERGYSIHNFPDAPAFRMDTGELIHGVVVKPHPTIEATDRQVRPTLHRVAAAAEGITGHYRFYAYTDATIALDPSRFAPPVGDGTWTDLHEAASWAAGTPGLVCSSFVWAAVQRASAQRNPKLLLEGGVAERPDELLPTPVVDGLYRYTVEERRRAAEGLVEYLIERTRTSAREGIEQTAQEAEWLVKLLQYGTAALALLLAGPTAAVVLALGCDPSDVADLVLAFNDMPAQVANQMANTFARDAPGDIDGEGWRQPGEGVAVSPDDVLRNWDPPDPAQSNDEVRHGLWGHSERMLLVRGRREPRHRHEYRRSEGVALVRGRVLYQGGPVLGADVRIGCEHDLTRPGTDEPTYALEVPAGRCEVTAQAYWPDSAWMLTASRVVDLAPGGQTVDLELEDPPVWRRRVRVFGKVDLVHRVLIGTDDWLHEPIVREADLSWTPTSWAGTPPPGLDQRHIAFPDVLSGMAGDERVRVTVTAFLREDLSVEFAVTTQLTEDWYDTAHPATADQIETGINEPAFVVPADGSASRTFTMQSADLPPDRARIELTFTNERMPA
jgi:hypothetical protein